MRPGSRKIICAAAVFGAVWLALRTLVPLFSPFLAGLLLALAAEPMVRFLTRNLHVPRGIGSGIGVSMAFCFLAMVLLLACAFLVRELGMLRNILPQLEEAASSGLSLVQRWLLDLAAHAPQGVQPLIEENVESLFSDGTALMRQGTGWLLGFAGNLLSHVPDSALSLGTAIISAFLISAKLPKIQKWLLRRIPRQRLRAMTEAWHRIRKIFLRFLLAQGKLMGVTFTILVLGFVILRIPYALVWALGVCLVDAFPVLGTGTVLLPWSLVCLLREDTGRAVGIASLYVVISLTRSILEPKLLGRHLGLDPLVTLMAMYAGFQIWGVAGMFFAPILTVVALQILPDKPEPM